jgi:hypothetical protein
LTLTFLITFVNLFFVGRKNERHIKKDTNAYIVNFTMLFVSFFALSLFIGQYDFIYDLNIMEPIIIFVLAALVFILNNLESTKKIAFFGNIIAAGALYYFVPDTYVLNEHLHYVWLNKLSVAAIFLLLTLIYKYINGVEGVLAIQTFYVGIGIFLLGLFSATSLLIGLWGGALAGVYLAFYVFNTYPSRLNVTNAAANSISIIVVWLMIKNGQESSLSCSVVFGLYFIAEAAIAAGKRLSLLRRYEDIYANTFSVQANARGLSAKSVETSIMKVLILMLIFGCLQIYAPNYYSIPIFAAIVMLWFLNRLLNWDVPRQTLKEMNKSLVKEMKDNINEVKKIINRD